MDFVIIANSWGASLDNPTGKHQIALKLAEKGHRVLWIEGSGMRKPCAGNTADHLRILSKIKMGLSGTRRVAPNIWKVSPLIIPLPTIGFVRSVNSLIYLSAGLFISKALRFKHPVLMNFLPIVPLTEKLWPGRTIYFCVDRWDKFDMYDTKVMAESDALCCRYADTVLTTSADLQARCKKHNPHSVLIGHGVNYHHFSSPLITGIPRPQDLPDGIIIGFFGLISEWVDQDLLINLARRLRKDIGSSCTLVLIGKADVDISRLKRETGICILGPKPFLELPSYTAFFNVAIIPFVINELTVAVNPIKLREMLASGCPTVSTKLPEVDLVAKDNPYAKTVDSAEEFITEVINRAKTKLTARERLKISETMRQETWSAKVDLILETIE